MNENKVAPGLGLAEDMLELSAVETAEARFLLMWLRERLPSNALGVLLGWSPVFDNDGAPTSGQCLRFGDLQRLRRARKDHILAQPRTAELEVAELATQELGEPRSPRTNLAPAPPLSPAGRVYSDPVVLVHEWQKRVFHAADQLDREAAHANLPRTLHDGLLSLVKQTREFARRLGD